MVCTSTSFTHYATLLIISTSTSNEKSCLIVSTDVTRFSHATAQNLFSMENEIFSKKNLSYLLFVFLSISCSHLPLFISHSQSDSIHISSTLYLFQEFICLSIYLSHLLILCFCIFLPFYLLSLSQEFTYLTYLLVPFLCISSSFLQYPSSSF